MVNVHTRDQLGFVVKTQKNLKTEKQIGFHSLFKLKITFRGLKVWLAKFYYLNEVFSLHEHFRGRVGLRGNNHWNRFC
jgi:hypothetical protein